MRRINTEEFIAKARAVHGDRYGYEKTVYVSATSHVTIICPEHGFFKQRAADHTNGSGCPICAAQQRNDRQRSISKEHGLEFSAKANKVHGVLYEYHKVSYKGATSKVIIVCKLHGDFLQTPASHLSGRGCPACAKELIAKILKNNSDKIGASYDTAKFIQRALEVHGSFFDYSKTIYMGATSKLTISCPIHGEFQQTPSNHLRGSGCRLCAVEENSKNKINIAKKQFEGRAKEIFGNLYDYSKVHYHTCDTSVQIVCKKHGEFLQAPSTHLRGSGCPKCSNEIKGINKTTQAAETFVERATSLHGEKYSYEKVAYLGSATPVTINCKVHGLFEQTPSNHLAGCGCPKCVSYTSKAELEIGNFLSSFGVSVDVSNRSLIKPMELDIVIEEVKVAIEYCGLYWHRHFGFGDSYVCKPKDYHQNKLEACLSKGYRLLTVFEDEWMCRKAIVQSLLARIIGRTSLERIGARSCQVTQVESSQAKVFFDTNHLSGHTNAQSFLGLFHENRMVACASFSPPRAIFGNRGAEDFIELVRFAQLPEVKIHGGLAKLCNSVKSLYPGKPIVSYIDRRWFTGTSYLQQGFTLVSKSEPGMWYWKGDKRYSRFSFAKHTLEKKLETFDPALSGNQNMLNNGYSIIYDCGALKMVRPA